MRPLAFSKELLPVGSRVDGGHERPIAVSEYLVERLLLAGVSKLCFVISAGKSDIMQYYGRNIGGARICYVVQNEAAGLCDALFCAEPFILDDDWAFVGLPDTIWFPANGLRALEERKEELSFLLFPVETPEFFDAVVLGEGDSVTEIQVKNASPASHWVWGAFRVSGRALRELKALWERPERHDEYIGTLVNAFIERGGRAGGVRAGSAYVDVGTVDGYREATKLLDAAKLLRDARLLDAASGPLIR